MADGTSHLISIIDIASCIKDISMFSWLMMLTVCLMTRLLMTFKAHSFSASSCPTPPPTVLTLRYTETEAWE